MTFQAPVRRPDPPSRAWYALAGAIVVLGAVAAGVFLVKRIGNLGDNLTQVVVPGEATLTLAQPGNYTIFHERESVVDGRVYSSTSLSGLRVTLRNAAGERVPLSGPVASTRYNFGGRSGVGIFEFRIAAPGRYRLTAAYDGGRTEPRTVLSVGSGFVASLLGTIFGGLGFAFGGVILGVAIAVPVFVKRRKAAQFAMAAPAGRPPTVR